MTFTLREEGGTREGKYEMLSDVGDGGLASILACMSDLYFFIRENWIWAMTRHHANNMLLTKNLPFGSDVRQ